MTSTVVQPPAAMNADEDTVRTRPLDQQTEPVPYATGMEMAAIRRVLVDPEVDVERQDLAPPGSGPAAGEATRASPDRYPSLIDLRGHSEPVGAVPTQFAGPLDPLVKALLRAVSLSDVAAAVVAYGAAAADARWVSVVLLDRAGAVAVSLLAGQEVRTCRLDSIGFAVRCPWTDAIREGVTLEFPSTADVRRAYPKMEEVYPFSGEGAIITLPLAPARACCGAVTFGFDDEGGIDIACELSSLRSSA